MRKKFTLFGTACKEYLPLNFFLTLILMNYNLSEIFSEIRIELRSRHFHIIWDQVMTKHFSFHREVDQLKKRFLDLGALVEDRVRKACTIIENRDPYSCCRNHQFGLGSR